MQNNLDFMLFDALRRAGQTMRAHRPSPHPCEKGGPAVKREIILAILSDSKGSLRQNQLASAFRVSPSTLSEMLNRLETDGMIERVTDSTDRRATLLVLTEKGAQRADEIKQETQKSFDAAFGALSDDEKRQLIALLHKIPKPDSPG